MMQTTSTATADQIDAQRRVTQEQIPMMATPAAIEPRTDIDREIYRAYIQAEIARWPGVTATIGHEEMPGVWMLYLQQPGHAFSFEDFFPRQVDGHVWIGDKGTDYNRVAICWSIGNVADEGYDGAPAIEWSAVPTPGWRAGVDATWKV